MKTTVDFLNAIKKKYNLPSDYALAGKLELSRASISRFMNGKDHLGDETAMKVADLLEIDPAHVVACIHAERAKTVKEKKLWERFATLTAGAAALLLTIAILPSVDMPTGEFNAAYPSDVPSYVYYVKWLELAFWPAVIGFALLLCVFTVKLWRRLNAWANETDGITEGGFYDNNL